ncbi:DNA-directed RNA polymerase subunit alpha [Patescibacteria group bacterium]|nr:DNA-directed RNA polymerase subunit alpha [Patescibacteria group bacterium]MBU1922200.1 DNA-directed RNA polymerase subunit alpha [Patescibacteria group bacterium]
MENILLPNKISITPGKNKNEATLTVEPCYQGYGTTIGNALRRVLLSSLPGAACYAVKIKNAEHEFSTLTGVKEDALEITLNLKQLRLRVFSDEPVRLILKAKGEGVVKAKDIEKNADVEIVNSDLHIAQITDKNIELDMEIFVNRGRGYVPIEERDKSSLEVGTIALDAVYSPIINVGYKVENTRVGEITNYDKLILMLETDGTIKPEEAIDQVLKTLLDHFTVVLTRGVPPKPEMPNIEIKPAEEEDKKPEKKKAVKKSTKKK